VARRLGLSEAAAGIPLEGQPGEYLTDRLTDAAVDFIHANRERPFFLLLSHYAVHIPIQARQNLVQAYEGRRNPASPHRNPDYAAMLESVDISVGRVMRALEEFGLAERTSIIFTSDNGGLLTPQAPRGLPPTSNHPLREGKGHLYEGGIRVPLIITWPGVANPGSVCKDAVISTDFFPTIIDMAGARPGTGNPADGVSLAGLLKRTGKFERDTLYWHWPHYAIPGALPASAIRRGNYKLIEFLEDGRVELYNLAEDIGEQRNLAPQLRRKSEELLKALQLWRHSVQAGLMRPNPNYRP
jgi:arylsulfatase A-like enzyme